MDPPDLIDMNTVLDNTSHAMLEDDIPHGKGKLLVCLDWASNMRPADHLWPATGFEVSRVKLSTLVG